MTTSNNNRADILQTNYTIVVVDDSAICSLVVQRFLTDAGYTVRTANSACDAIAIAADIPVDLFLLDIVMPGASGLALLKELKIFDNTYEAIMISGNDNLNDAAIAMEHGAFGYLTKPVQRETLLANVRRALASVNCKKQRFRHLHQLESKITARTHELEKAMHLLENQGRHLDTIINGMDEGLLAVDNQNAIVLMNTQAQNILGVRFGDCAGQKIETAIKDPAKADALMSTIRGSNTINESYKIMTLFGTRHFAVSAQKTIDDTNSITGYVITLLDQSEKIRNNLLQDSFLSIVAHELRTPINVIMNFLALLRFQGSDEVMRNMALTDMRESSERMKYLVNSIMSFVNLSSVSLSIERMSVNILNLIETEAGKLKTSAADKNVVFDISAEQQMMTILTDQNLLRIATGNVLSNAVKYNKRGGRVTVRIKQDPTAESPIIVINIEDEGDGISGRARTNLFQCFIQGEDPMTRSHQGLGTGLFLAKRATELLGGTINVSSTRGKGACFSLSFPIETKQLL